MSLSGWSVHKSDFHWNSVGLLAEEAVNEWRRQLRPFETIGQLVGGRFLSPFGYTGIFFA